MELEDYAEQLWDITADIEVPCTRPGCDTEMEVYTITFQRSEELTIKLLCPECDTTLTVTVTNGVHVKP
ncbi:unnamed protein product [marine sediment metagenome]|uniref:Uncharacterized protein n=1 Tax=marine sediment metagenome TaxID=412755 RepID=X0SAX5_9ZZZZ